LENCRAAETAMGEEHGFAETVAAAGGDDFGGDPSEFGEILLIGGVKKERN